jgi:hypothetical protein
MIDDFDMRIGQASCLKVPLFSKEGLGEITLCYNPPQSPFKKGGSNGGSPLEKGEVMENCLPGTESPIYI